MRASVAGLSLTLALFGRLPKLPAPTASARPSSPQPPAPVHRDAPLPMLPSVSRVRVEAARDRVLIMEEINLPRGDWREGNLDFYVAFGAPGPPIAVDVRLFGLPPGESETRLEDSGDPVAVEPAVRRVPTVQMLLGKPQMAGVVVHVKESQLRRAYASSDLVVLRVRTLLHPPAPSDDGAYDVVVRLGMSGGLPMTIGHIQVASLEKSPWLSKGEARLCGPEADPWPLSVAVVPRPARIDPGATIAPSLALRHASDDLCIRWWAPP